MTSLVGLFLYNFLHNGGKNDEESKTNSISFTYRSYACRYYADYEFCGKQYHRGRW